MAGVISTFIASAMRPVGMCAGSRAGKPLGILYAMASAFLPWHVRQFNAGSGVAKVFWKIGAIVGSTPHVMRSWRSSQVSGDHASRTGPAATYGAAPPWHAATSAAATSAKTSVTTREARGMPASRDDAAGESELTSRLVRGMR